MRYSNLIGWIFKVYSILIIDPGVSCKDLHGDTSCLY